MASRASWTGFAAGPWAIGIWLGCAGATGDSGRDSDDDGTQGGRGSGACTAAAGDYLATYSAVRDDCGGVAALPSETYRISSEGEITSAGGRAIGDDSAPSGCVDSDADIDGCVVSFQRECASELLVLGVADVRGDYRLDFDSGSGSVAIRIGVYDGPTLLQSCQGEQRISISSR